LIAYDHHLECCARPRQDLRTFDTYPAAVAGLVDHFQHCYHPRCDPDIPYIVSRKPTDDEPSLNTSNANARILLAALGLLRELGPDDVPHLELAPGEKFYPLDGSCDSADLLARIDLALALDPADPGLPWHQVSGPFFDCGRRADYTQDVLTALRAAAVYAHQGRRGVSWA